MKWLVSGAAALFFVSGAQAQETPCFSESDILKVTSGQVYERIDVEQGLGFDEIIVVVDSSRMLRMAAMNDGCQVGQPVAIGLLRSVSGADAHA